MASDMIKLGGLWSGKDKEGNTFLSGKLSPQVKILIFKNKYRESENHPTHIMYLSQVETQGQRQADGDQTDEFFDDQAFQRGQARVAQGGHLAPEDVPPPADEYTATRRSPEPMRGASSSQPRPQQARPTRQPAPPPDFDEDLKDPFADDDAPAPAQAQARPAQARPGTGRNAPF
jgi:hypothetical protein